jgi:hypothetical protein
MGSEFKCEIAIDVSIPDWLDATVPLKQIGNKVVTDSQRSIRTQTSPDGELFIPLSPKTIKDKQRLRVTNPDMALYRKGIMYGAIHAYANKDNEVIVGVISRGSPRRDLVAMIHQEIGVKSKAGRIIRPFLGISSATLEWANYRMQRWIEERAQKAAKKIIKLTY